MARKCLSSDKEKRCSEHLGLGLMGYALPALGICHFLHGGCKCRCEAVFELRLGSGCIGSPLVHWAESHITKDAHVREAILVSALTLLFAPFLSACPFNMYPGAKRVSDARHTGRAIACSTPDASRR
jgi:hypothetical protein